MRSVDNEGRARPGRRPISVKSYIEVREGLMREHVFRLCTLTGMSDELADSLAREALRRTRVDVNRITSNATKQDLRTLKIRRSP